MSAFIDVSVRILAYEGDLDGALVVGNIHRADKAGPGLRNVPFPCGHEVEPRSYAVEPGRYLVQATLPSGLVLTQDAEAREGEQTPVVFDATDSPYESHSWQYLMGNTEPRSVYHDMSTTTGARSAGLRHAREPALSSVDASPLPTAWSAPLHKADWSFERMAALLADSRLSPSDVGHPLERVPEGLRDRYSHLYRFVDHSGRTEPKRVLILEFGDATHVTRLPVPWGEAQVEVLVNDRPSPTGSAVAITLRDRYVGAGLAYMAQGALDAAATLFSDAEAMLFDKLTNPLAAAAAGYVLVGTDLTDEQRMWDQWLGNLRDWFPWMSDGSVLHAIRVLRRAQTEGDLLQAKDHLIEACARGIPYYTLGLTWLIEGLSEFEDDPVCAQRLRQARALSWRTDMREPFVILGSRGAPR